MMKTSFILSGFKANWTDVVHYFKKINSDDNSPVEGFVCFAYVVLGSFHALPALLFLVAYTVMTTQNHVNWLLAFSISNKKHEVTKTIHRVKLRTTKVEQ
jgi:hypothetical protein